MMTREEAIRQLQSLHNHCQSMIRDEYEDGIWVQDIEALDLALSALRPVSRERVEEVWPECDCCEIPCNNCESIYAWDRYGKPQECTGCPENGYKNYTPESQFCEFCGRPLTDEAVEMLMERLEKLYETI